MARVRLIVWNDDEAKERSKALAKFGHEVVAGAITSPRILSELRRSMPQAILIDLAQSVSKGRWLAMAVRSSKSLRPIPLVLIGGEPAKVAKLRELLPDAAYCEWSSVAKTLERVLKAPPQNPVAVESAISTGASLNQKLGLKAGVSVRLVDPPASFLKLTGLAEENVPNPDLTIAFVDTLPELEAQIAELARKPPLWIAWRKARPASGLTMPSIREVAFSFGLVDYKGCAIDETWSAMLFTRRKIKGK